MSQGFLLNYFFCSYLSVITFQDYENSTCLSVGLGFSNRLSGDDFTEGDRAPYDSSYLATLRKLFTADSTVYIRNAEIRRSDPFMNIIRHSDRLRTFNPNIIMQTLSSGDLNADMIIRGMERLLPYGQVLFKKTNIGNRKKMLNKKVIDSFLSHTVMEQQNNC